ncbi:MAG: hypothetical protein ACRYGG_09620 [Janthinobacterium lividum]
MPRDFTKVSWQFAQATSYPWTVQDDVVILDGDVSMQHAEMLSDKACVDILPRNLVVQGNVLITCSKPFRFPDRLVVKESLVLGGVGITELPKNISVHGSIALESTGITELPAGLKVLGSLDLHRSPIATLPDGLWVQGDLMLQGTSITHFPRDMNVGGWILPPPGLLDLQRFMHDRPDAPLLMKNLSGHERLQLRADMQAFPDLLRVIESRDAWEQISIHRDHTGYILNLR